MWVWQFEAAIMKHCKLGGLYTTETYFLQSWRLEVWDQGASIVWPWWESSSGLQTPDFSLYSHMVEAGSQLSGLFLEGH